MFNRAILVASLVATAVLLVLLNFTTPTSLGSLGVFLFFILVYIVMLGVATGVVIIFRRLSGRKGDLKKKDHLYAAVIAFAPIMLLLAQSLGSLGVFTLVLTVIFVTIGCFYVNKRL